MKIALIGYGRMGREIESVATARGHEVTLIIDHDNTNLLTPDNLAKADAAIEFTTPASAAGNVITCLTSGIPVVSGTTGWNDALDSARETCKREDGAFIHASNFSPGVNIFFALNKKLAALMDPMYTYDVNVREIHHTRKLDKPSGTAITIAEGIIEKLDRKSNWVLDKADGENDLVIEAIREGDVPGTHIVNYTSDIDNISISHEAQNRRGFAYGAVLAAEFLQGKTGVFTMQDVLGLNH